MWNRHGEFRGESRVNKNPYLGAHTAGVQGRKSEEDGTSLWVAVRGKKIAETETTVLAGFLPKRTLGGTKKVADASQTPAGEKTLSHLPSKDGQV